MSDIKSIKILKKNFSLKKYILLYILYKKLYLI